MSTAIKFNLERMIVTRNKKLVWKRGPSQALLEPIFFYHASKYKQTQKLDSTTLYGPTFSPFCKVTASCFSFPRQDVSLPELNYVITT